MSCVRVGKTTAVGAQHLYGHLRSHGTLGNSLSAALESFRGNIGGKILDDPLRDQDEGKEQGKRQQEIETDAGEVHPEVPDGLGFVASNPTHQRCRHRNAGGSRDEILESQSNHLRPIGHGALAPVILPVRIRRKAHGSIEGQISGDPAEPLGIQGKPVLKPQHRVGEHDAHRAENDSGDGILFPILLPPRVNSQQADKQPLNRLHQRIKKGRAADVQDPHQVEPKRLRDNDQDQDEKRQLEPAHHCHKHQSPGQRSFFP